VRDPKRLVDVCAIRELGWHERGPRYVGERLQQPLVVDSRCPDRLHEIRLRRFVHGASMRRSLAVGSSA
jgi:hypothetical protein